MANQYYLKGRLSFPALSKPSAPIINGVQTGEPKYSCTILIDKQDAEKIDYLNKYLTVVNNLATTTFKGLAQTLLAKNPVLHDGDVEKPDLDGFAGSYFVRAKSSRMPKFFYRDHSEVPFTEIDRVFYPGCEVLVIVNPYAYGASGQSTAKGVSTGLMGVMFVKDGQAFGANVDVAALPTFDDPVAPQVAGVAPQVAPAASQVAGIGAVPQVTPAAPQVAPAAPAAPQVAPVAQVPQGIPF